MPEPTTPLIDAAPVPPRAVLIYVDENGRRVPPPDYVPKVDEVDDAPLTCSESDRRDLDVRDFYRRRSELAPFVKDLRAALEALLKRSDTIQP
jgi:hypothetical protein